MEKSKGKKIVLFFIILLLIVLIIAGGAYAYIATDLLKSPDMLFKKYLLSQASEISKFNVGPYKDGYERMKKEKAEIKFVGKNEYNLGTTQDLDEDSEKKYLETALTLKTDYPNKNLSVNIDSKLDGEEYLKLDLVGSKDALGLKIEDLHEKYITIENRDLKKLAKTFNVDENTINMIPDKLPEITLTEASKKMLLEEIKNIISNELSSVGTNSYTQEKYVIDNYNGEKFEGNKYVLTTSSKKFNEMIYNCAIKLCENEQIRSALNSDELLNKLKENIIEASKKEENLEDKAMKISVYSYDGKTIKLDVTVNDEIVYEMYTLNKENSSSMQIKYISSKSESNKVASESLININSSFEKQNGEISYEEKTTYDKKDIKALKEKEADENPFYSEDEIDEKYKNIATSAKATITSENDEITAKITTVNKNKDKQTSTQTMKFGNIEVQTLNSDENIVINDYTEEDFSGLVMEFMTNGAKTAQEKPNTLVGTIFGFLNNFSGMFSDVSDTDENLLTNIPTNTNPEESDEEKISEEDIAKGKGYVHSSMVTSLSTQLDSYRNDLSSNPNTNPADYLTAEQIEDKAGSSITNVEIIDGETLKCNYKGNTYFVKIYINGDTWELDELLVLYSEDGTLENAK